MSDHIYSLFDDLEIDTTNQRVASRRALALADTRVENKLGQFLRGARTEEEFFERLGLVQEDFDWHIKNASEEVGYDHPDYINKTLTDHYLLATKTACGCGCDKGNCSCGSDCKSCDCHKTSAAVEFEETPAEEEEEQTKESARSFLANPYVNGDQDSIQHPTAPNQNNQVVAPYGVVGGPAVNPPNINPATLQNPQAGGQAQITPMQPNDPTQQMQQVASWDISAVKTSDGHWIEKAIKHPGALHEELGVPQGEKIPEEKIEEATHSDNPKERERANLAETLKGLHHGAYGEEDRERDFLSQPGYQADNYTVCPGCGTDHADPSGVCPNCGTSSYEAPQGLHHGAYGEGLAYGDRPDDGWHGYGDNPYDLEREDQEREDECKTRDANGNCQCWGNQHIRQSAVTELDPYINNQTLSAMKQWAIQSGLGDENLIQNLPPHNLLVGVNRYYKGNNGNGVRGFLIDSGIMPPQHQAAMGAQDPAAQDDNAARKVSCPSCGGGGKISNGDPCTKCAGEGKVHNFGGSVLDALDQKNAWIVVTEGNTDLGGPEPKIDKDKQTDSNPKKDPLDNEDEGRWPTKQKDITDIIKAENREVGGHPNHEVKEIGEKTTESETLPNNKGDAGFDDGKVNHGPHTDTWHTNDGQVEPVTHEKQQKQ